MSIKLQLPTLTDLRPRLMVIGVGGAGCNAINNMIAAGLTGVDFVVANTDAQALAASSAEHRVQLGTNLTEGLGAGSKPEIGEAAAEEAIDELRTQMAGAHMVFIASGMGGGTGTGAAAVIARVAKELGILTVGIVTKPFFFEGTRRMRIADIGINELRTYVDTLIVIPNQNLFRVANEKTTFAEAFVLADQVLYSGVACIVDLILKEGLINLDFADVRTVMSGMGTAMMGTGEAAGERRAIVAAEEAIANPLLDDVSLRGARGLLLSISGGRDLTLYEVDEAATRVRQEVDPDANIIVGATFDETLGDRVRVSIVASGMARQVEQQQQANGAARPQPPFQAPPPVQAAPPPPAYQPPPPIHQQTAVFPAAAPPPIQAPPPLQAAPPAVPPQVYEPEPDPQLPHAVTIEESPLADPFGNAKWTEQKLHPQAPAVPVHAGNAGQPQSGRREWQAPGGAVIIEEGPPPVVIAREQRGSDPRYQPAQAPSAMEAFAPEMPVEVRRPPRRMPELDDFPAVAQREYRSRNAGDEPRAIDSAPPKRPSLFARLSGKGRITDDSAQTASAQHQDHHQQRTNQASAPRQRTNSASGWNSPHASVHDDQPSDIPQVFSRDRK